MRNNCTPFRPTLWSPPCFTCLAEFLALCSRNGLATVYSSNCEPPFRTTHTLKISLAVLHPGLLHLRSGFLGMLKTAPSVLPAPLHVVSARRIPDVRLKFLRIVRLHPVQRVIRNCAEKFNHECVGSVLTYRVVEICLRSPDHRSVKVFVKTVDNTRVNCLSHISNSRLEARDQIHAPQCNVVYYRRTHSDEGEIQPISLAWKNSFSCTPSSACRFRGRAHPAGAHRSS